MIPERRIRPRDLILEGVVDEALDVPHADACVVGRREERARVGREAQGGDAAVVRVKRGEEKARGDLPGGQR